MKCKGRFTKPCDSDAVRQVYDIMRGLIPCCEIHAKSVDDENDRRFEYESRTVRFVFAADTDKALFGRTREERCTVTTEHLAELRERATAGKLLDGSASFCITESSGAVHTFSTHNLLRVVLPPPYKPYVAPFIPVSGEDGTVAVEVPAA